MTVVIVYESMYGQTRRVAEAIGDGVRARRQVDVEQVGAVDPDSVAGAELLVVGGPTHVHSLSSSRSREAAVDRAGEADSGLVLEPGAAGPGARDWLHSHPQIPSDVAAFDTRQDVPALLSGRASVHIAKRLRRRGGAMILPAESFLVDKHTELLPGELDRARRWGVALAERIELARSTM